MVGQQQEIGNAAFFGTEKITRILFRMAPPTMLAQLIQALYNIVDSFFVGKYSESGLTALSIMYPVQLLMIAAAVGTGVGINIEIARCLGIGRRKRADETAGVGTPLIFVLWLIFAVVGYFLMPVYARMSTDSPLVIADVIIYGRIVCVFGLGLFVESVWSKVLQAEGNMKQPMIAQIVGALVNIVLDPILIFGKLGMPELGIEGAAIATVIGQMAAMLIVWRGGYRKPPVRKAFFPIIKQIYKLGLPSILMQSAYTFYILGLNLILAGFSDQAVTALGLYYKWQTFFFIPLGALQTCIVPILSFNFAAGKLERCRKTLRISVAAGMALMMIGVICFEAAPGQLLHVFSSDEKVIEIGVTAFRIIALSFVPIVTTLIFPVFFQAIGQPVKSSALTIVRTVFLFVPLGWLLAHIGLSWFWLTFPITETATTILGAVLYRKFLQNYSGS